MRFRCKKLYADLVSPDGTVCVAYIASIEAWGARSTHAGLELYWPDGRREIVRASPRSVSVSEERDSFELSFDLPDSHFVLAYRLTHGAFAPSGPGPCDGLRWSVKAARAEAVARWISAGADRELHGTGYVDQVELERPARSLKLELLQWGRVHLHDATLVYTALDFQRAGPWRRMGYWSADKLEEYSGFGIETGPAHTGLDLTWGTKSLCIAATRTLHSGDAIDRDRFPTRLERLISSAFTGPAVERRVLGRAGWFTQPSSGWALHEAVCFGDRGLWLENTARGGGPRVSMSSP